MTTVYLSPFDRIVAMSWSKRVWMLTDGGELVGIEPDGTQDNISTTWATLFDGLGIAGRNFFAVKYTGTRTVQVNDIVASTNDTAWSTIPFDTPNDCASDGVYLYVAGIDTSNGSVYRVAKYDLSTAVAVWDKTLGSYNGGAVSIAANPNGFMLMSNEDVEFYDADGVFQGTGAVVDNLPFEWSVCATRDRFFFAHKDSFLASGITEIKCYDASGAFKYTVTPPVAAAQSGYPAATEENLFFFMPAGTALTNHSVLVMDRTVTRDTNGDIVTDVVSTTGAVTYDLGFATNAIQKAAVDSSTYSTF